MPTETWTAQAKEVAEALALLAAGGFFIYKAITGYLRVNLSLNVRCKRQRSKHASMDHLAIQAHIKKGPNGSMSIHDVRALVTYEGGSHDLSFLGTTRSTFKFEKLSEIRRAKMDWQKISESSPLLQLVPDEEISLGAECSVPAEATCTVQVAILGQRLRGFKFGQWKASSISLPLSWAR